MMDIAEIRKKARQQKAGAEEPLQEKTDLPKVASEPLEDVQEEAPGGSEPVHDHEGAASSGGPVDGRGDGTDGLDRLFAGTDTLALATDESYAELLENTTEGVAQNICQYMAFHLGEEEYALDIGQISEIIKVREFTDVPRAPGYVLGIISLRGVIVPVFDLRARLNLGRSELLPTSRIVVSQYEEMTVGLLVDSINQVVDLVVDEIEPPPGVLSGIDRDMVYGIGRFQGKMIILLQISKVLDVEMS